MYRFSAKASGVQLCKTIFNAIHSNDLFNFKNNLYYYDDKGVLDYAHSSITFQVIECYKKGFFHICGVNLIVKDVISLSDGSRIFMLDELGIKLVLKFTQEEILNCVVYGGGINFVDFNLCSIKSLMLSSKEMDENLVEKFCLRP